METGRLEIRVVSGPNLGATISLEPGIYVVGSHDTCDFILADDTVAPRHLALELIRAEDQTWRVTARPLDGEVFLEGLALPPEGLDLPTGRALALGFTALVWQPPGQDWGPVRLVPLEFLPTAGTAPAPAPEPLPAAEDEDEAPTDPEPAQLEPRLTRRPWFLWLGLAVLATLLVLMLNDWSGGGRQAARAAGELVEALTRENLGGLTVAPSGQDLVVEGELVSDADLVRLVTLARSQPHKVFLRVSVKNDLVRAAREALGAHGFLADVFLKPDGTLVLSAYMRDQRVEDLALENLAREVPSLVIGSRRIVHADELSGALTEELRRAGLTELKVRYLSGRIELVAPSLTPDLNQRLEGIFSRAGNQLKVPLVYTLLPETGAASSLTVEVPVEGQGASLPLAASGPLVDLAITGVTLTPLRFVTTNGGHRLFEGSRLPSGYTITAITAEDLVLTREEDGQTRVYHHIFQNSKGGPQ